MPVGDQQPLDLLMDDEAWACEPVRLAEEMGHSMYADHGTQRRWTCRTCGNAVLVVGCNIYGSAVSERCNG